VDFAIKLLLVPFNLALPLSQFQYQSQFQFPQQQATHPTQLAPLNTAQLALLTVKHAQSAKMAISQQELNVFNVNPIVSLAVMLIPATLAPMDTIYLYQLLLALERQYRPTLNLLAQYVPTDALSAQALQCVPLVLQDLDS
jgi:hypothetical protein